MTNTSQPLVSIIAICHKHAPYVLETLESIRKQTYSNIELIIINNIKDECEGIIQTWIKEHEVACKFIQNEVPLSITKNLNLGLTQVNGEYFQGISCDDVLMPNKTRDQVLLFESIDNKYACIYGDVLKIDALGNIISKETEFSRLRRILNVQEMPKGRLINEISERPFIHAPSVLLKKEAILQVGTYDTNWAFEDWPMWITLSYNNYHFHPIDKVNVHYRILETSLDRNKSIEFYLTYIKLFSTYSGFLNTKSNGLRKHWLKALEEVRNRMGFRALLKYYVQYVHKTNDYSIKSLVKSIF